MISPRLIALPVREFADAMRAEHTTVVNQLCAKHAIPADHIRVHQGGTRDLIMMLTDRLRTDIVVMGAVSRSGLKGLFLGNTAEDVLDRLPCDLLIVKPSGFTPASFTEPATSAVSLTTGASFVPAIVMVTSCST